MLRHASSRRFLVFAALLPVLALFGCGDDEIAAIPPTISAVEVTSPTSLLQAIGDTVTLRATARDASGREIEDVTFTWWSSATNVIRVDEDGRVTAIGSGSALVTASADGVRGSAEMVVEQAETGLRFVMGPVDAVAGSALDPAVQVEVTDPAGYRVPGSNRSVTLRLSGAAGGELLGTRTVPVSGGVATFAGLTVEAAGSGYTITARSSELPAIESAPFDVAPAAAAGLRFSTQPSSTGAGQPISPGVEVAIIDGYGNAVHAGSDPITLSLGSNPGGDDLSGTLTTPASAGVAAFTDVALTVAAGDYTLRATAPGLDEAESDPFPVTAADAAAVAFVTEPAHEEGKEAFTVVVGFEDAFGNPVAAAGNEVTLSLVSGPEGAAVEGATVATADGVATFEVSAALPGGDYRLDAVSPGLASDTTAAFRVSLTFAELSRFTGGHQCGTTVPGHLYCWGLNRRGQLGDGTITDRLTPHPVAGDLLFATAAGGGDTTCALGADGTLYCWGANEGGQLGTGGTDDSPLPAAVSGGLAFSSVTVGARHSCALTAEGAAYCWGDNARGQLGDGTTAARSTPTAVSGGHVFAQLSAGTEHTCGVTNDSTALCWGNAASGRLGNGDAVIDQVSPDSVLYGLALASVSAGEAHSCAIQADGLVWCWGSNTSAQLGTPGDPDSAAPVVAADGLRSLSAGLFHSCGLSPRGYSYCWGAIGGGGEFTEGGLVFDQLTAGGAHSCATAPGPVAYCWGNNGRGQLGDGTRLDSRLPVPVRQ